MWICTSFVREIRIEWYCFLLGFFLKKFLADTCPFGGATGTPALDFWWRLFWVSKPEWVLPYSLFCGGECNVHSLRSTSRATLADLLAAGVQPVTSLHACAEVGLGFEWAITSTEDVCATIVSATRFVILLCYIHTTDKWILRVDPLLAVLPEILFRDRCCMVHKYRSEIYQTKKEWVKA